MAKKDLDETNTHELTLYFLYFRILQNKNYKFVKHFSFDYFNIL